MTTVFITGDRSIPGPAAAGLVALTMLKAIAQEGGVNGSNGVEFATGTEAGVEEAVRMVAEMSATPCSLFETPLVSGHEDEGWKDFAQRAKNVLETDHDARFVVIHADAHASRITKALVDLGLPDGQLELVTPSLV